MNEQASEQLCRFVYKHYRFIKPAAGWFEGVRPHMFSNSHEEAACAGRHGLAFHYQRGITSWPPEERGGYTFCLVYESDEPREPIAVGLAECSPRDAFCYRVGRDIARGRVLKKLEEMGKKIWTQ